MNYKKCKVVMLATDKSNYSIIKDITTNELVVPQPHGDKVKYYQLYILSDKEIKKSDWFIQEGQIHRSAQDLSWKGYYKIIATTDKSLENWREAYTGIPPKKAKVKFPNEQLPQISQDFITKYIEKYNKGNKIEEVLVEYDERKCTRCGAISPVGSLVCMYPIPPMPCSGDLINTPRVYQNYISIKPIKDNFTLVEIETIIKSLSLNDLEQTNEKIWQIMKKKFGELL